MDHFISGTPAALYDENNPNWAPSLYLRQYAELTTEGIDTASARYTQVFNWSRKRTLLEVVPVVDAEIDSDD